MRAAVLLLAITFLGVARAEADKKPAVVATPSYARFLYVQGDPLPAPAVIVLAASDGKSFKISSVTSDEAFISVKQREAAAEERLPDVKGKQYVVEIALTADAPVGPIATKIHIKTTHRKAPLVDVPVSGAVRARPGAALTTTAREGRLLLTIVDAAGAPVAGATVVVSHESLRQTKPTDAQGAAPFLLLDATLAYTLHVEKAGYAPLDGTVTATPGDLARATYTLTAK
ncbi:MAG TPA: carboxypeptidase-like regulatory domain-containing protein [Kofleriaceae bacterium]|nr:carboxypeptidase-like regulatory domain-containing protein [Kofleriaceae bacterium]